MRDMEPQVTSLEDYAARIDRFNETQPNRAMLNDVRAYNHFVCGELDKLLSLKDKSLLDIGASPHGYALERCLSLGVGSYCGIGLDISEEVEIAAGGRTGCLQEMNAESLAFKDAAFDIVVSMSTFEHIADVPKALSEIHRILKVGGGALICFEPLWTCAYGHHLHQFSRIATLVPDWAHLHWDPARMRAHLSSRWIADAELDLEATVEWIYEHPVINRVGITAMRKYFYDCGLRVEWMVAMPDERPCSAELSEAQEATGLPVEDLMTRGLSVLLYKEY